MWLNLGGRLYHSRDAARTFQIASGRDIVIEEFGFGLNAPGRDVPALYAIASRNGVRAIWRSDDGGKT